MSAPIIRMAIVTGEVRSAIAAPRAVAPAVATRQITFHSAMAVFTSTQAAAKEATTVTIPCTSSMFSLIQAENRVSPFTMPSITVTTTPPVHSARGCKKLSHKNWAKGWNTSIMGFSA